MGCLVGDRINAVLELTDRYQALCIPYPNPDTMCTGQCEGTGWIPIAEDEIDPVYRALAQEVHLVKCPLEYARFQTECDGWHFVRCQDCNGTGLSYNAVLG